MYRKTARTKKLEAMRAVRARKRLETGEKAPFWQPPKLRRIVIVIDYDYGKRVNIMHLYRTSRIDQYRAVANGQPWRQRVGFSAILDAIRKSFPPVRTEG